MHISKPLAGTRYACLHLIENQQCIILVAKRTHLLQILIRRHMHAALALNRLEQYSADVLVHLRLQRLDIAIRHKHMARAQRTIANVIIIMTGGSQRIKGASVEGLGGRNNLVLRRRFGNAILTRQLHSALVGLCTAVSKENAVHTGCLGNHTQRLRLNLGIIQIRAVHNLGSLLSNRLHQHRMIIAKAVYRNAGERIDILIALAVPHAAALPQLHDHLISAKNRQIIFFSFCYNCFFIHKFIFPL